MGGEESGSMVVQEAKGPSFSLAVMNITYEQQIAGCPKSVRWSQKRTIDIAESFSDSDTLRRFEVLFMSFIHCTSRCKTSLMNVKMMFCFCQIKFYSTLRDH